MDEKDVVIDALDRYATSSVDFIDAYLAAHAKAAGTDPIITFNSRDFQKLNVPFNRPGEI